MATDNRRNNLSYGLGEPLLSMAPEPIVAQRAPTTSDRAEIGTLWIDQPADDGYVLTQVASNVSTWIGVGGGSGVFTGHVTAGTYITAGTTIASGTTMTVGTDLTVSGLGLGVVQSDATGLFTSSAGTDGQLLVAGTGVAPVWAAITSATLVITPGSGTLNIEESGGTANSFVTDVAGPIAPLAGVTTMAGGTNITTDGSVANTITWNLDDNITLAGSVTAGVDLTMSTGDCTISADTDGAQTIYLHADGGTNETIDIHSDQGTGVASIEVHSDVGGLTFTSGLASADAINIDATDAAGGIDIDYGTGGMAIDGANGAFALVTGTGAIDIGADAAAKTVTICNATGASSVIVDCGTGAASFGASATAHTTTIGSTTGASSTVLQSGTGDLIMTSTDDITIDGAGILELNSSAGIISIGNDADAFAVNVCTGAAARDLTAGSTNTTSTTTIESGSGGIALNSTLGSTTITATEDAADAIYLHANAGTTETIRLHADQGTAVNSIGLISDVGGITLDAGLAAANSIIIDASDAAGGIDIDCGTNGIDVLATGGPVTLGSTEDAADAIYLHANGGTTETIRMHSDQGTSSTSVHMQSDVGGCAMTAGLAAANSIVINASDAAGGIDLDYGTGGFTVDATNGAFTMQTGTGTISIGADAAAKSLVIGNTTGATDISLDAGTGGIDINSGGIVTMTPATDTQAGAGCTANANVGVCTFTGLVTAAAASQVLTVTNSVCTAGSAILCSLSNLGGNDAQMTITRVTPAAGSFTVTATNNGAAALNGNIILTFWIIAA